MIARSSSLPLRALCVFVLVVFRVPWLAANVEGE
jgi:hypothetical protein